MRTLSVQQMPNGFELEVPTFGYWFKAGMGFTLGAGAVSVVAAFLSWIVVGILLGGIGAFLHILAR